LDDPERIPIDIGYEVAAVGVAQTDPRATMREDGTLVIDLSVPQPCAPEPSTDEEIVVCAAAPSDGEPLPPPPSPTPMEKLQEALTFKLGPVEIGPGGVQGGAGFSARVRF
jgi:hypothetical protein